MTSGPVILITALAVLLVVVVVLAILLRPRMQRRWFAGTGIERWQTAAAGLPWPDRWVLYWANSRGRAAPSRLAALGVERGEVMLAMTERMLAKSSGVRRVWLWMGAVWIALAVLNLVILIAGIGEWSDLVAPALGLATVFLAIGPWQKRQARLIRRSVELNRQQLEEGR